MADEEKQEKTEFENLKESVVEEAKTQNELDEAKEIYDNATPERKKEIEKELEEQKLTEAKEEKLDSDNIEKKDSDSVSKSDEKDSEKKEVDKTTTKIDELNLSGRLLQAAYRNHLTDDEIINLGDQVVPVLTKLADNLDRASTALGEAGRKYKELLKNQPVKKEDKKSTQITFTDEEIEQSPSLKKVQDYIGSLESKIGELVDSLKEKEKSELQTASVERDAQIDQFFDDVSEFFPELGDSKKRTNSVELALRRSIWEDAENIMVGATLNGGNKPLDEALGEALSIYEGKNPRKTEKIRQEIIDDTKKRESQIVSRPTSKKTKEHLHTGDEKAISTVANILREKGRDVF